MPYFLCSCQRCTEATFCSYTCGYFSQSKSYHLVFLLVCAKPVEVIPFGNHLPPHRNPFGLNFVFVHRILYTCLCTRTILVPEETLFPRNTDLNVEKWSSCARTLPAVDMHSCLTISWFLSKMSVLPFTINVEMGETNIEPVICSVPQTPVYSAVHVHVVYTRS